MTRKTSLRRTQAIGVPIAAVAMVLAGCAPAEDSETNDNITMQVFSPYFSEQPAGDLLTGFVEEWNEANADIQVEIEAVTHDNKDVRLQAQIAAGEGPCVLAVPVGSYPTYVANDYLVPLNDLIEANFGSDFKSEFIDVAQDAVDMDDEWYAIPTWGGTHAILYNTEMFSEASVDVPNDWETFVSVGEQLTADGQYGFGLYGSSSEVTLREFMPWLWAAGGDLLTEDLDAAALDTPEAHTAFEFYSSLDTEHGIVPPGSAQMDYPTLLGLFSAEQLGMLQSGPWAVRAAITNNPELEGKIGIMPVPGTTSETAAPTKYDSVAYGISPDCQTPDEALQFLAEWSSSENQITMATEAGQMPTLTSAVESPEVAEDQYIADFLELLPTARNYPASTSINDVALEFVNSGLQPVLNGSDPSERLTAANDGIDQIVGTQ